MNKLDIISSQLNFISFLMLSVIPYLMLYLNVTVHQPTLMQVSGRLSRSRKIAISKCRAACHILPQKARSISMCALICLKTRLMMRSPGL